MAFPVWKGGAGRFDTAADWSTGHVPQAGDSALIASGRVTVLNEDISGVALQLGGYATTAEATLVLENAVVGNIELTADPAPPDAVGVQAIDVVGFADITGTVANDFDSGDQLTIALAPASVLLNTGTIAPSQGNGNALTITGLHGLLVNEGRIVTGFGQSAITPDIIGTGTIVLGQPPFPLTSAKVALGGSVGPGQHLLFDPQTQSARTTLQLDKPMQFHGVIDGFAAGDSIELPNITITAATFSHDVLTLDAGHDVVARLRFSGSYAADNFALSHSGGASIISFAAAPTVEAAIPFAQHA